MERHKEEQFYEPRSQEAPVQQPVGLCPLGGGLQSTYSGSNGGGAFLIAYLIFIALFGTVGLAAEYAVGRRARTGTLGAYEMAWASRRKGLGKVGGLLGWLPLAGSMCIAIGYAAIIAYVLKAFANALDGSLMAADTAGWFEAFSTADYAVLPFHAIVVVGTLLTLLLGAKSIERTNKVMMPVF